MPCRRVHQSRTIARFAKVFALLAAGTAMAFAAERGPVGSADFPRINRWTTEDGLPQNGITCLRQTRDGLLWIGTRQGLVRFDGVQFDDFEDAVERHLSGEAIRHLVEDPTGRLWVGTKHRLWVVTSSGFQALTRQDSTPDEEITCLGIGPAGHLWLGTDRALYRFTENRFRRTWEVGLPDAQIFSVAATPDECLWVGTYHGLFRLDPRSGGFAKVWEGAEVTPTRHLNPVLSLATDSPGNLWFGSESGLGRVTTTGTIEWPVTGSTVATRYRNLSPGLNGGLLMVGGGRLERFVGPDGPAPFQPLPVPLDHSSTEVTAVLEDTEGNLWIGTDSEGLLRVRPSLFRTLGTEAGLPHPVVWSLHPSHRGGIWAATSGGLAHVSPDSTPGITVPRLAGGPDLQLRCVLEDHDGCLWLGSAMRGAARFDQGNLEAPPTSFGQAWSQTTVLHEDRSGRLWLGFKDALLCFPPAAGARNSRPHQGFWEFRDSGVSWVRDGESVPWTDAGRQVETPTPAGPLPAEPGPLDAFPGGRPPLPPHQRLASYDVRCIHEDARGILWLGTWGGGVHRIEGDRVDAWSGSEGPGGTRVACIHEEPPGTLWFGTEGGLACFRDGRWDVITPQDGLPDAEAHQILGDGLGNLWIAGYRGIYRASLDDLLDRVAGRRSAVPVIRYSEPDGLRSAETSGDFQPGALRTPDGRLWFPTTRGIVLVDPTEALASELAAPVVVIDAVIAQTDTGRDRPSNRFVHRRWQGGSTETLGSGKALRLPPGSGVFVEIRYTTGTLTAPERATFHYHLDGHDPDWIDAGTRRVAHYSGLRPGRYQFRVMATNHRGSRNPVPASLALVVEPHLHQRREFQATAAVLAIFGLALFARWRWRVLHRLHQLEKESALTRERERIRRDLHDDVGLGIARITRLARDATTLGGASGPLGEQLRQIVRDSEETARAMHAIIWTMNPRQDRLDRVLPWVRRHLSDSLAATEITLEFHWPESIPTGLLPAAVRQQLYLVLKEAVANILVHSRATRVMVTARFSEDHQLILEVTDNGLGFDPAAAAGRGNGLSHMPTRMAAIGGRAEILGRPGSGATVRLVLPWRPPPQASPTHQP